MSPLFPLKRVFVEGSISVYMHHAIQEGPEQDVGKQAANKPASEQRPP